MTVSEPISLDNDVPMVHYISILNGGYMKELIEYTKQTLGTSNRPQVLTAGGIYIWNQEQTAILAGPFESVDTAYSVRSKALDKALRMGQKAGS